MLKNNIFSSESSIACTQAWRLLSRVCMLRNVVYTHVRTGPAV